MGIKRNSNAMSRQLRTTDFFGGQSENREIFSINMLGTSALLFVSALCFMGDARGSNGFDTGDAPSREQTAAAVSAMAEKPSTMDIREYRITGIKTLSRTEVEMAVYGFTGPKRVEADIEAARAALEKAYHDKGYQTVSVSVPPQRPVRGIIVLQVKEMPVGNLTVKGSRYFDVEKIRKMTPSLAEGKVPNFNDVQRDIIALNLMPDRRVTPSLKAGKEEGTVDVELEVKDKFPLHGSIELNNRYSFNTTPLRLDVSARYDNLWQLGHTVGFGYQVAPQRPSDATVYSGYYIARAPGVDWVALMLQGTRQNSDVSTLGGSDSIGNGVVLGGRFLFNLPSKKGFYQSASMGLDYKRFEQDLVMGDQIVSSPVGYWPFSAGYNGTLVGKNYLTEWNGGVCFSFRGTDAKEQEEFDSRRYNADANFFYFRGGLAHTQELPWGFQLAGELQGQVTANPLIDSEQFSLGGQTTVRGYLESAVAGDSAVCGSLEVRTPSLLGWVRREDTELRLFCFLDGGKAWLNDGLPEQTSEFSLWSYGVGGNFRFFKNWNGVAFVGVPQISQTGTAAGAPLFSFRLWTEL